MSRHTHEAREHFNEREKAEVEPLKALKIRLNIYRRHQDLKGKTNIIKPSQNTNQTRPVGLPAPRWPTRNQPV